MSFGVDQILNILLSIIAFWLTYEFHAMRKEFHHIRKSIETLNISVAIAMRNDSLQERTLDKHEDRLFKLESHL